MDLIKRDLAHVWHPCMQMKDFEQTAPIVIESAKGEYLNTTDGRQLIDGIASWWCKSLGHQHPRLMRALVEQAKRFEHVILANTTNEKIVELSERLCALTKNCQHVFFASEGSSAVEIALKMAVHAQQLLGHAEKNQFMALSNGYHGETCLALSASDVGIYREAYESLMTPIPFIEGIPYVNGRDDPLWENCEASWPNIEKQCETHAEHCAAIILEPIVQGAGGMKIYSPDLLRRLRQWCDKNKVFLIADEIMTGIGRTGEMLAINHAGISADMICLSKGVTSGVLPFSVMMTTDEIYQLFYDDYHTGKAFLHSHTYSGNALAVAVANEVLKIFEEENILAQVAELESHSVTYFKQMQNLSNIRALGGIIAAEITTPQTRAGYQFHRKALEKGALLRPLGNTLYWCPPLNISNKALEKLAYISNDCLS